MCARLRALRGFAVNNLGTLLWLYAVVVVQHQTSGALAARHAGLKAVALYHPQWHVGVKAGFGARRSALVEDKAPLHRAAHSWGRQAGRREEEDTESGSENRKPEAGAVPTAENITVTCERAQSQLTAQRRAPPLQHHAALPAAAGVGLQRVAQTLVGVGPAGAQVVHAGAVPGLRRHHAVARLEGGRLQHLAAGVGALPRLVAGVFAGVHVLAGSAGSCRVAPV